VTRALLLDFYGTLAHATSWGPRFEDVLATHGLGWPDERPLSAATLDGADHLAHSADRDTYVAWERSRLQLLVEATGAAADLAPRVVDDLYNASKTWEMAVYAEVPEVLRAFRARGWRIVICSNWDWDLEDVLATVRLDGMVDHVVTSARAGYRKPHPAIYERTLAVADAAAEHSVFAGDSWGPDVEGPLAAGIPRAVHVYREGDPAPAPDLPAGAHRVADLSGLLALTE
jgi:putative hydrolase of the HAD superfamily